MQLKYFKSQTVSENLKTESYFSFTLDEKKVGKYERYVQNETIFKS